jgi:hypothetical protein
MMPGGGPLGAAPSTSSVRAPTNALAGAPMPPVRPDQQKQNLPAGRRLAR